MENGCDSIGKDSNVQLRSSRINLMNSMMWHILSFGKHVEW